MAAVNPIYFIDDRCRMDVETTVFTASSTGSGYAIDNAREAELATAWKPNDGTADEYLQVDGGSTTWLGAAGSTLFACVAYDARGADQTQLRLQYDTADNPAFTSIVTSGIFQTLNNTRINCDFGSFTIPSPAKRYYRLAQTNGTRGGGTITAKILNFAMFSIAGIVRMGASGLEYPKDAPGESDIEETYRAATVRTAGGVTLSNKYAQPGQIVVVRHQPSTDSMQTAIRDLLYKISGTGRAIYATLDGLSNVAIADFFMVQLVRSWQSSRRYVGQLEVSMQFETAPWI